VRDVRSVTGDNTLGFHLTFPLLQGALSKSNHRFTLLDACFREWVPFQNFELLDILIYSKKHPI